MRLLVMTLVMLCASGAMALTPDTRAVEISAAMAAERGESVGAAWLERELESERELIQTAGIVAVGRIASTVDIWARRRNGKSRYPSRRGITIHVERYLRGACGDTLLFWQHYPDPYLLDTDSVAERAFDTDYEEGATVVVLVYAGCAEAAEQSSCERPYRYAVVDGEVVSKGVTLELFLLEIEDVLQAGGE